MGFWTILVGLAIGLLSSLLAVEIADRSDRVSRWLVRRAVKRLPDQLQDRYEEAWLADVVDKPGRFSRIVYTAGLITAASNMDHDLRLPHVKFESACIIRTFDVALALVAIFLLIPHFLLVAIGLRITGCRPILYRARRVGLNGKPFYLYKFNTTNHPLALGDALSNSIHQPRRTKFGQLLRKIRLDEIPQFFNVLIGDMSWVGPRPEKPEFVEVFKKQIQNYNDRQRIRPGITGWAQLNYPYGASLEDAKVKLRYDREAVNLYSVRFWLKCWILTLRVVLWPPK